MHPIRLLLLTALGALLTAGCSGDTEAELNRLANAVSDDARGHVSGRDTIERTEDISVEQLNAQRPSFYNIRVRKWFCGLADGAEGCSAKQAGVPVDFIIDTEFVDPASIQVSAPAPDKDHDGFAILFDCAKVGRRHCYIFQRVTTLHGYERCSDSNCNDNDARLEEQVKSLASTLGSKCGRIECGDSKTCQKTAERFFELVTRAAERPFVKNRDAFKKGVAAFERAVRDAEWREHSVDGGEVIAGFDVITFNRVAYRTNTVKIDPEGRLHVERLICVEDDAKKCEPDGNWRTKISHVTLADLNPSQTFVHDYTQNDKGGRITHEWDGYAVKTMCRDSARCVTNEGILDATPALVIPCHDKDSCRQQELALEGLISFASTETYLTWAEKKRAQTNTASDIKNEKAASRAAQAISTLIGDGKIQNLFDFFGMELLDYSDANLEGDILAITGKSYLCLWGVDCEGDEEATDDSTTPADYAVDINLAAIDTRQIRVNEIPDVTGSRSVTVACLQEQSCVSFLEAQEFGYVNKWWPLPCRSEKECQRLASELRGLGQYAQARSGTSNAQTPKLSSRFDKILSVIGDKSHDAEYAVRNSITNQLTRYRTEFIDAGSDGRVRVALQICTKGGVLNLVRPTEGSKGSPEIDPLCAMPDSWSRQMSFVDTASLERASINTLEFDLEGLEVKENEAEREAATRAVFVKCADDNRCVFYQGVGDGERLYVPCDGPKACREIETQLSKLIRLAQGKAFERMREKRAEKIDASRIINDTKMAKAVAARLSSQLTSDVFDEDNEYSFQQTHAELRNDQVLSLRERYCDREQDECDQGIRNRYARAEIDLSKIDLSTLQVLTNDGNDLSVAVLFECAGEGANCITYTTEDALTFLDAWLVTCADRIACIDQMKDFAALATYAGAGGDISPPEPPAPGAPSQPDVREPAVNPYAQYSQANLVVELNAHVAGQADTEKLGAETIAFVTSVAQDIALQNNNTLIVRYSDCRADILAPCARTADGSFVLYNLDCSEPGCSVFDKFAHGSAAFPLDQLAIDEIDLDVGVGSLHFECQRGDRCIRLSLMDHAGVDRSQNVSVWHVPCESCGVASDVLLELAMRAQGLSRPSSIPPRDHNQPSPQNTPELNKPSRQALIDPDLPRAMRQDAEALHGATRDAEIQILAAEGRTLRKMVASAISLTEDGQMTLHRQVCLALLPIGFSNANECRQQSLFQDYDIILELAQVDPDTIEVAQSAQTSGERGLWVTAACRPQYGCAQLVIPSNPSYVALQTQTLMQSFVETQNAPKIRMPCADGQSCNKAVRAFSSLAKDAAKRVKPKKKRAGDFVGLWEHQAVYPTGWMTEYKADGTFVFTTPTSKTVGTYTAKNGQWTQRSDSYDFEDSGTYRILDDETIEITGKYGPNVWRRRG
ncbi:MAG: hypothetical protein AAGC77_10520 [Pseudomonadota bacterium]